MSCFFILCYFLIGTACSGDSKNSGKKEKDVVEWMKLVADETPLCRLSMPGTHDSGAKGEKGIVATQDLSIGEQLECGIRCFDIRLRAKGERLKVYHGIISQGITFEEEVLPVFVAFLEKHPTEMLFVSLKDEGGDIGEYKRLLKANLSGEDLQSFIIKDFRGNLTLGECRGKILFLHRTNLDAGQMIGGEFVGWKDNVSFEGFILGNNSIKVRCHVEDEYNFSSLSDVSKKVEVIVRNIEAAGKGDATTWFVTFVSATSSKILSGATPRNFADQVNPLVAGKIEGLGKWGCGIVFLDFAGKEQGLRLVNAIIAAN